MKTIKPNKLIVISDGGIRNKHGQKMLTVQCSCNSTPFLVREDSYKSGRSKSCGHCGKQPVTEKPVIIVPVITASSVEEITPESESVFERGSVDYLDDEIKRRIASLISTENQIRTLDTETAQQTVTNCDTLKKRKAAAGYAKDLQSEIAALSLEKSQAETAVKKDDKSAAEIMKEKIAALRGKQ